MPVISVGNRHYDYLIAITIDVFKWLVTEYIVYTGIPIHLFLSLTVQYS